MFKIDLYINKFYFWLNIKKKEQSIEINFFKINSYIYLKYLYINTNLYIFVDFFSSYILYILKRIQILFLSIFKQ